MSQQSHKVIFTSSFFELICKALSSVALPMMLPLYRKFPVENILTRAQLLPRAAGKHGSVLQLYAMTDRKFALMSR